MILYEDFIFSLNKCGRPRQTQIQSAYLLFNQIDENKRSR